MAVSRDIPFNMLVQAPENVRRAPPKRGLDGLVASIRYLGIRQNLVVYPETNDDGTETGKFAVVAGERRRQAKGVLVKKREHKKTDLVPCQLCTKEEAIEISLAENTEREGMHPADEMVAYAQLIDTGRTVPDVAARFGVSELVVRQRLKLGRLSPRILEELRVDSMNLAQAQALAVSDDHGVQERAWFEAAHGWDHEPRALRQSVTITHVSATDPRVKLVGLPAYEEAGGTLVRDLFDDAFVRLENPGLLDELATAKLRSIADALPADGAAWVEPCLSQVIDYDRFRQVARHEPIIKAEIPGAAGLADELDALNAIEEPTEADIQRIDEIEAELGGYSDCEDEVSPDVRVGALVLLQHYEPFYRVEWVATIEDLAQQQAMGEEDGDDGAEASDDEDDRHRLSDAGECVAAEPAYKPLSSVLIRELTAERTMALRVELARNPVVALVAAAHAHALELVYDYHNQRSCLDLRYRPDDLRAAAVKIKESPAALALAEECDRWRMILPAEAADLWSFLLSAPIETVLALHAFGVSQSVQAVVNFDSDKPSPETTHADQLAAALTLDMNSWWTLNRGDYLGRVSKEKIAAAVAEGVSPEAAENIAGLKKAGMVAAAADRLAGTGWLPQALRTPPAAAPIETALANDIGPVAIAAE